MSLYCLEWEIGFGMFLGLGLGLGVALGFVAGRLYKSWFGVHN
jgi:hypothetical protein